MNPRDLQAFAAAHLEPRLSWLKRRDLIWREPSAEAFVTPVEFVATPIEWIECSLVLVAPPANLDREKQALVGLRFVALWRPDAPDLDVGLKRPGGPLVSLSTFRHRWPIRAGTDEQLAKLADELAAAATEQWPAAVERAGNVAGYAAAIGPNAQNTDTWLSFVKRPSHVDVPWLETLAYAHLLMGEPDAAHDCIVRLRRRDATGKLATRANLIDRNLFSNPSAAVDQLYAWRHDRLTADGLLDWAAPRGFAARKAEPTAG